MSKLTLDYAMFRWIKLNHDYIIYVHWCLDITKASVTILEYDPNGNHKYPHVEKKIMDLTRYNKSDVSLINPQSISKEVLNLVYYDYNN